MKIILAGYMGSGKSTIGKILSNFVRIPFYDLDEIIEKTEKKSIKSIFNDKGEIYFRKLESQIFNQFISENDNFILALGGGTPCYANNHLILQNDDINSFYLKANVNTLTERLILEKENRPLISNFNKEELNDYIRKHLFDRNHYYLQSKNIITIDNKSIEEIKNEILAILF
ncbi:shikimate kinase [Flavobacterium okayamense]|uniref:Shikimate kinase n=1 Tax=Flavobacterium okayamense TaxID=2830782 RepID=A0ABM7S8E4_9FLAO|nr:shikimate kinase [Flavobacterium okayamense]BCY29630.1 shikimate kinase [Flavobacterium okayamense]